MAKVFLIRSREIFFLLLFLVFRVTIGSSQTAGFSSPPQTCLSEKIEVTVDEVIEGVSYSWDFCNQIDLNKYSYKRKIESSGRNFYSSAFINLNNKTYLFATDQQAKSILIYSFDDLSNEPKVWEVKGFSGGPKGFDVVQKEDGIYFVTSLSNGKLGVVKLNNDLTSLFSIKEYEGLSGDARHLEIVEDSGQYYVFVANSSVLTVAKFGDSFSNTPVFKTYPTSGYATGVSLKKHNGTWYGLLSRYLDGVFLLTFPNGLDNAPSSTALPSIANPTEVNFLKVNRGLIATVATINNGIKTLKWDSQISANPVVTSVSYPQLGEIISYNFSNLPYPQFAGGININTNQIHIYEYDFCSANKQTATGTKELIFFKSPGIKDVTLTTTDVEGNVSSVTKQIEVLNNLAPQVQIIQGENQCVSNPISLSAQNITTSQTISSYTWTFKKYQFFCSCSSLLVG